MISNSHDKPEEIYEVCKCVEPAQKISSWEMAYIVCRKNMIKEKHKRKNGRILINQMNV